MEFLQEITLELNSNTAYTTVGAKQGDGNSRIIKAHITKNGLDWAIPAGIDASYRVRKPDGYAIWNPAIINYDENVVYMTLTEQTLSTSGRAYADLVFSNGTGSSREILSTVSFIIIIMAAPDITNQVASSNEFGRILDLTENATIILNESEAWAIGTKSGVPVIADSFSYTTVGGNGTCTIDAETFREYVGTYPGYTIYYYFTCTESPSTEFPNGKWQVQYQNTTLENINLSDYGITLSGTWFQTNSIRVLVTDSDQQYHNDSKYWSQVSRAAKESIDNLDIDVTMLDEDQDPYVDKDVINEVTVTSQPSGYNIQVDEETFIDRVGEITADYVFYYNDSSWALSGSTVDLTDYGISGIGTPQNGDSFTIHYNNYANFQFYMPRGHTGNVNFLTFEIDTETGMLQMYRPDPVTPEVDFKIMDGTEGGGEQTKGCLGVIIGHFVN